MKNRDNIYLVIRMYNYDDAEVICGAYRTVERADEVAAAMQQQFNDRNIDDVSFTVRITTWYDE